MKQLLSRIRLSLQRWILARVAVLAFHDRDHREGTVLVLSPGGYNVGDQALYDAAVQRLDGPIRVVMLNREKDAYVHCNDSTSRVIALPGLLTESIFTTILSAYRFYRLVAQSNSLAFVGADVMDGGYSKRISIRLWDLARASSAGGTKVRVLGFSWNGSASPLVIDAAKSALQSGVYAFTRDPVSHDRFSRQVGYTYLAADIVFGLLTESTPSSGVVVRARGFVDAGMGVAVVNLSALIAGRLDQLSEYNEIVVWLRSHNVGVILLPHVFHPGSDDRIQIEALYSQFVDDHGVVAVYEQLSPGVIKSLLQISSVVVTGRMHLAVLSLSEGVPPITLSTQGKVEGLMQVVGRSEYCVEPLAGFGKNVVEKLEQMWPELPSRHAELMEVSQRLRSLAERNFMM